MLIKLRNNFAVIIIILLTVISTTLFGSFGMKEYSRYDASTITYEKGRVVEITSEQLEKDADLDLYIGAQELLVEMLEGEDKGKTVNVTNYLTSTHNIRARVGMTLIFNVDRPDSVEPYYFLYNYDRTWSLIGAVAVLFATIICVSGKKGVKSILALVFSLYLVFCLVLPLTFSGYSPIFASILCAVLSTAVTLLLLNGQSKKTYSAIAATTAGVLCSLLFYLVLSAILHINGFNTDEAESLVLISRNTGLKVNEILFAGVLIASLGAIMDTAMSIVSALYEIHHHSPELSRKQLIRSGIEIGKDMIGTMTNTLILAFAGSTFVTLLVFISYNFTLDQLINSNYLSIEIAQGLCGTFGIVLSVPATALIAAISLKKK